MADAIRRSPILDAVESPAEADAILVDGCFHEAEGGGPPSPAQFPGIPWIVLSVPAGDRAPGGSFAAEVAGREAALIGETERWCVLRCAAFGEELAWSTRYETAGALYTAWQPEGAPWVAVADVVSLVERVLVSNDRWGSAFDVTGPAVVSLPSACEMLEEVHGRPVPYVQLDEGTLAEAMEQVGFDPRYAAERAGYMVWTTSEPCRALSPVLEHALGRPPAALADYLVTAARSSIAVSG
ncbi:hypothetical protein FOE67_05020 [Streptomyces calidiresistens]|uniref:Uncharacterized protein n=1 Tax=Streptomyces calidiresistens TaxID=1485586 RepID=A0A7W3XVE5_9ACTN|nr:hypothetical protein [Streptomyces calidiresistens]